MKVIKDIYCKVAPWCNVDKKIDRLYRKMNRAFESRKKILTRHYCYRIERKYRCSISPGAKIDSGLSLPHPDGVIIGEKSTIGKNVTIYQQVTIGQNHGKYPTIGDNVIIYAGAKIIGGINIGDNSIIGANAVVTKDIPANSIWGGNPAKEIKKRDAKEEYK